MFCPNCGGDNRSEQNYCRSCGLKLDAISRNVADQFPSVEYAALQRRKERFEKLGLGSLAVTGAIGIGMVFAKAAYYKLMLFGPEVLLWSAFGAFALFALLAIFFFNYPKLFMKFEKIDPRLASDKSTENVSVPTNTLIDDRPFEPVGSVTEHSTELLPIDRDSRTK
ncbi:MAG: zinc ribbon domain-containing protein [Pyrinomonadaceae bacterium]